MGYQSNSLYPSNRTPSSPGCKIIKNILNYDVNPYIKTINNTKCITNITMQISYIKSRGTMHCTTTSIYSTCSKLSSLLPHKLLYNTGWSLPVMQCQYGTPTDKA